MDEYDDIDVSPVFLPGVDLGLWFRLILMLIATLVTLGVVLTLA